MGGVGRVGLLLGGGSLAEQHLQRPTRTPSCAHRGWEQAQPPRTEQRERRSPPRRGRFCAGHWTSWDRCWARDGKASHGALVLAQMSDLHSSCKWLFPEMFRRKLTISIQFKMPLI